jgi:hypothetical protein
MIEILVSGPKRNSDAMKEKTSERVDGETGRAKVHHGRKRGREMMTSMWRIIIARKERGKPQKSWQGMYRKSKQTVEQFGCRILLEWAAWPQSYNFDMDDLRRF